MFRQQWQVINSLPERRDLNRKHVQPVIEIFAKTAGGYCFLQIPVRRGHNAHIRSARPIVTNSFVPLLLKNAQQLVLNIQRNLPHLIQEDGSALGRFKASGPIPQRPGKSPPDMAKKLAFEQLPWNGGAIDSNQRAIFASAAPVNF